MENEPVDTPAQPLKLPTCLVGVENKLIKDQSIRIVELERTVMEQRDRIRELEKNQRG